MPRKVNPKCKYCALNYASEDDAKAHHPDCYQEKTCYQKRYRIRNSSRVNSQRRGNYAKEKGVVAIDPISPESYRSELFLYGKEKQYVHAVALKIYQGSELKFEMAPQQTQGITQAELKDYISKLFDHVAVEYGCSNFGRIYWLQEEKSVY